jgi:hypothetical protein
MLDIVTVVFREELPILKLQAQSIELYCQNIGTQGIYVIVNDNDSVADEIDPAWWGNLSSLVKIVPRSEFKCVWTDNGWVSQQALKMLGSSLSNNTWSMVVDAKTLFVSSCTLTELVDSQQRIKIGSLDIYDVFKRSKEITDRLFGIDLPRQLGPGGVPFFFHNKTIRELIEFVETKQRQPFAEWFQSQGMLTEFILYSGYVHYRDGSFNLLYSDFTKSGSIINICHSQVGLADVLLGQMSRSGTWTVSVHRNAWNKFTPDQKHLYKELLQHHKISLAQDLL